jgi:FkbM family methyltransferase
MGRTDQFGTGIGKKAASQQLDREEPVVKVTTPATLPSSQVIAHELTRILPEPDALYVAQPDNASALLRIVEEQARDLVKLRRALVGANSVAEERRKIIEHQALSAGEKFPKASRRRGKKTVFRKLRKIGSKLRPAIKHFLHAHAGIPRKHARQENLAGLRGRTDKGFGYESLVEHSTREFLRACRSFGTDVVLDVGANTGQFAQSLRHAGYTGHIVSFEPLSDAHVRLVSAAASDALWDVAERCAVGAAAGETQINIARNSYSSSLLPMLERHSVAAPESVYNGVEACRVVTLDDCIERTFSDPTVTFGLKIDTQGYEAQVLLGARRSSSRIKVIMCEMSLIPLYEGAPTMTELCRLLAEAGYRCVAIAPEFEDPKTGELLQVNGTFIRQSEL